METNAITDIRADSNVAEEKRTPTTTQTPTILLIDDDEEQLELFGAVIKDAGYRVLFAQNATEAVEKILRTSSIDCIISDIMMPYLNGRDLLKIVRSIKRLDNIPIIMLTASAADLEMKMLESGADMYCRKHDARKLLVPQIEFLLG